jgi:hypothetical protein
MSNWRGGPEAERWDEEKSVRLLLEAGALVGGYEAEGARMPADLRERYHASILEAHNARDMDAYREAVNGYVEAAREAYRRRAGR